MPLWLDDSVREQYQVWFSYLIRTGLFKDYLHYMRSGDSIQHYTYDGDRTALDHFAKGYNHWYYHLLPGLWTQYPADDEFEHLWTTWVRRQPRERGKTITKIPWQNIEEAIIDSIFSSMDFFEEEYERVPDSNEIKNIVSEGVKSSLGGFRGGYRIAYWIDPCKYPHKKIMSAIAQEISQARTCMRNTGLSFSNENNCRYNSPIALKRDRGLTVLKRRLNFMAIYDKGYSTKGIASGAFDLAEMPYGADPLKTTSEGNIILQRQSNLAKTGDFTQHLHYDDANDKGVVDFINKELKFARKTLCAVEDGWFPSSP